MNPENTKPQSNPNPQHDNDALVESTQPLKNEPTPERAEQQKQQKPGSWEQKKSGAV